MSINTSYKRRIPVAMVPHIWIGSTFGPLLLYIGTQDFTSYEFYISIFFLAVAAYSIYKGIDAFKHGIYSDFIMLALIPMLLPVAFGSYLYSINT